MPLPQYQYDHWYKVGNDDFRFIGFTGRFLQMKRIAKGNHNPQEPSIDIACAYMDGFTAAFDNSRNKAR